MRIIFLDVDGVLNNAETTDKFCGWVGIDSKLVDILRHIYDESNKEEETKIVVSSSWRYDMIQKTNKSDGSYRYLLDKLEEAGMEVLDCTPEDSVSGWHRAREILAWLSENKKKYNVTNWVILDDFSFDFADFYDTKIRFIQTNEDIGLTMNHKEDILNRLRGKF